MFALVSRTRRRTAAVRPSFGRLMVERLEGRDAPSTLDVTAFTLPPTDSTDMVTATVLSPAPVQQSVAGTTSTPVVVAPAPILPAPTTAPQAGNTTTVLSTTTDSNEDPVAVVGVTEDGQQWNYTVNGTVTDPSATSFTVTITLDGTKNEGSSSVTPITNSDGTPTGTGKWSVTFGLPACSSVTTASHYGTAVATAGSRTLPTALFMIQQTPRVASTITTITQ